MKRLVFAAAIFCVVSTMAAQQVAPGAPTPIRLRRRHEDQSLREAKTFGASAKLRRRNCTRLQIFLDNNNFGPGKIDGQMGEFFREALISYKIAHAADRRG